MEGHSVRSAIYEMTKNDFKLALRYQNKFRTADLKLIEELVKEIKLENPTFITFLSKEKSKNTLSSIEKEINALVEKIGKNLRKENSLLRLKIEELVKENRLLKGEEEKSNLLYFKIDTLKENS